MKAKPFAIIGTVMLVIAIVFFFYAINHPEGNFPWSYETTWIIYKTYLSVMALNFLTAIIIKIIKAITK